MLPSRTCPPSIPVMAAILPDPFAEAISVPERATASLSEFFRPGRGPPESSGWIIGYPHVGVQVGVDPAGKDLGADSSFCHPREVDMPVCKPFSEIYPLLARQPLGCVAVGVEYKKSPHVIHTAIILARV